MNEDFSKVAPPEADRSNTIILIVEDDADYLADTEKLIKKFGYQTLALLDEEPAKVREILDQQKVDLVISDGLEGSWETIHSITQKAGVKMLLISSNGTYLHQAEEAGVKILPRGALEQMISDDSYFLPWFEEILSAKTK